MFNPQNALRAARILLVLASLVGALAAPAHVISAQPLEVGFAHNDITPPVDDKKRPFWMAGYTPGRRATGVHDPLFARCIVLRHDGKKIALVSVDLVGLQLPAVQQVRDAFPDWTHITVASTHNHEGPDVIGIWGQSFLKRGVDDRYLASVIERIKQTIREASQRLRPAIARFGTADDATLIRDARKPEVKDSIIRTLEFRHPKSGKPIGLVVQWNCHPEAMGARNTLITADFPATTVNDLQHRYECPVVYFSGALGGLMAPPDGIRNAEGVPLKSGDFAYAQQYGRDVAKLAEQAVETSTAITLTPFAVSTGEISIPVRNPWYRAARIAGVVRRGRMFTLDPATSPPPEELSRVQTETSCLRLGELRIACVPGEIYPELVYGRIEDPADPGADFPDAAKEQAVVEMMPNAKWMLFGLANDEVGYFIPKRQWDTKSPYAYRHKRAQYGEINSCGFDAAAVVMDGLGEQVRKLKD